VPYLNVVKFCPSDNSTKGCASSVMRKRKDGTTWSNWDVAPYPRVLLADGVSILFFHATGKLSVGIYADINGFKKPQILGRDIFYFTLIPDEEVPFAPGGGGSSKENVEENCKNGTGMFCAAMIIADGFKINY